MLFYNDRHSELPVDEEFQKNWRAVAVPGDDAKIEEYLDKQGIRSMQDQGVKKPIQRHPKRKGGQRKKQIKKPKDNEHIADDLRTYDD